MLTIVYQSNAGHTERYAKLLSKALDLPCYSLTEARKEIPAKSEILFMGWLLGGMIQGYTKAKKHYDIKAVCPVGMSENHGQTEILREKNRLPQTLPVFFLLGGFELEKVHGIYRMMMGFVSRQLQKQMEDPKQKLMPEAKEMMELMGDGKDFVDASRLEDILHWYRG